MPGIAHFTPESTPPAAEYTPKTTLMFALMVFSKSSVYKTHTTITFLLSNPCLCVTIDDFHCTLDYSTFIRYKLYFLSDYARTNNSIRGKARYG